MSIRPPNDLPSSKAFEAVPFETSHEDIERQPFIDHRLFLPQPRSEKKTGTSVFTKVMAVVNFLLGVVLATSIGLSAHKSSSCNSKAFAQFDEPYSPALEAVIPVIKRFKPEPRFQIGSSDELEAAWDGILGPNNGIIALDEGESARLAKTSHAPTQSKSGSRKHLYAISIYHQLDCLNTIRRSFKRDSHHTDMSNETIYHQSDDCFDFLRQAIQCHGDVSMMYLSRQDESSSETTAFVNPDLVIRAGKGPVLWDVEHSCRALAPIEQWVARHQPGAHYESDV